MSDAGLFLQITAETVTFTVDSSQYRTSVFDVTTKNPLGAKCIFCKSAMVTFDYVAASQHAQRVPFELRK
jgi:hypothetical protein